MLRDTIKQSECLFTQLIRLNGFLGLKELIFPNIWLYTDLDRNKT